MKSLLHTCFILLLILNIIPLNISCIKKSVPLNPVTTEVTGITQTQAVSGGNIPDIKEGSVILKGVCWSTEDNPTIENNRTQDGSRPGSFISTLTGLVPGTTYFVRMYIILKKDTVYGNSVSFTTKDFGKVTDFEGNEYNTIDIGTQTWMAQNLAATRYSDGAAIPFIESDTGWANSSKPGYCWYKNEEETFKADYGALYNWYAVNTGKLCPKGWHVPDDAEFTILSDYLGGEIAAGGKMKVRGTTFWVDPNTGADNVIGFSALPGGFRYYDGKFFDFGFSGYWWTSTLYVPSIAWFRFLYYNETTLYRFNNQTKNGFSVRCIKDRV